ncbi:MAG TPA: quinone oxidoreductase [Polyangia bacterium]|jgi:NADPH2:quinone reductase|nr:quinone oxidoreductase [Polyangia bacterium]
MPKKMLVHEVGGPEKLSWEDVPAAPLGRGEARIRHTAIGLNFIDVYFRTGIYKAPSSPFVPGQEAAGVVEEIGPEVTDVKVGDRVAYAGVPGAYCESRVIAAARLVPLPEEISDQQAAAIMLKGMTAQYLLSRCGRPQRGDTVLFHAAAGGVGLLACQWAKHLGVEVIGTVGSAEKARLAFDRGCAHVINYNKENFVHQVNDITHSAGVAVVFDSVGKTTFRASLDCLRARGMMVSFGQSSGLVPPLDITILSIKGSLFLTRPTLASYIGTRTELLETAGDLFDVVRSGAVKVDIGQTYALKDVARAHTDLEARATTGSTVLLP